MLTDNIDLNIWDKVGYNTEYKEEGWVITPYTIKQEGQYYGSGTELPEHELVLNPMEVARLTLGKSSTEGGDYSNDSDFWMDLNTFLLTYQDIPDRVLEWCDTMLQLAYNMAEQEAQDYREASVF
jgi:hypothetical protein